MPHNDADPVVVKRHAARERCLGDLDTMAVAAAHVIVTRERDCESPIEEFISSLLVEYAYSDGALTLEDVERRFEELKLNFSDLICIAKFAARTYPELIAEQRVKEEAEASKAV